MPHDNLKSKDWGKLIRRLQLQLETVVDGKIMYRCVRHLRKTIQFPGVSLVRIRQVLREWYDTDYVKLNEIQNSIDFSFAYVP